MAHRLVCSFHPSGASFAIVSHDQRLKLFSTLTSQLQQDLTEAQHLTSTITCIAYPTASSSSSSKSSSLSPLVALGTKSGEILLWNTKKGALEHKLGVTTAQQEKHQAAVTSLAFAPTSSFLFSASNDGTIKQWLTTTGACVARFTGAEEQQTAGVVYSRLAVSPDGEHLLAGGSGALTVWSISSPHTPVRSYSGGATANVNALAWTPDGRFVASGSAGERHVSVWSAEMASEEGESADGKQSKKQKKKSSSSAGKTTALQTITLPTPPLSLQFNPYAASASSKHPSYQLAVLSDSSIVSIVQFSPASSSQGDNKSAPQAAPVHITVTIPSSTSQSSSAARRNHAYTAAGKNDKHRATAASSTLLEKGEEGDKVGAGAVQAMLFESASVLQLARGDAVRPQFEKVSYRSSAEATFEPQQIVLGKYEPKALMSTQGNAAATAATGAAPSASSSTPADAKSSKRKASSLSHAHEPVTLGSAHTGDTVLASSSGLDGAKGRGEREAKRRKGEAGSKSDVLSRSLADRLAEDEAASSGPQQFNLETGELPKAGSLQTILQQALHSNDTALVEYCLTAGAAQLASNSNLIRSTVRRLSPTYVLPLLQHLMSKFASRPNRSAALLPWLREVFKNHTAYLIRQPQLTHKLAPLYHLLDTRLSVFKKLLKLQGRLELLLSQISAAKNPGEGDDMDAEGTASSGPMNTFNDGEGEDEEGEEGQEEDDEEEMEGSEGEEEDEDGEDMDEEGEDEEEDEDMDE